MIQAASTNNAISQSIPLRNSSWEEGVFETVSDGRVLDELEVVVSPGYRCRRGQVSIRGTESVNDFVHLSPEVCCSVPGEGQSNLQSISGILEYLL